MADPATYLRERNDELEATNADLRSRNTELEAHIRRLQTMLADERRCIDEIGKVLTKGGARPELPPLARAAAFVDRAKQADGIVDDLLGLVATDGSGASPAIVPGPGIDDARALADLRLRAENHLGVTITNDGRRVKV